MRSSVRYLVIAAALLPGVAGAPAQGGSTSPREQVFAAERAFAKSMADRDHEAFAAFLSEEAIFLGRGTLQGRVEVAAGWKGLFEGEVAPFSWEPETVEVLDSGRLAISTGPVWDAQGTRISTFTSIWRLEGDGVWRVLFDRGNKYCE